MREPAAVKGLAIVTAVVEKQGPPADTRFPLLLNAAQSPGLTLPPPNHRFDPSRLHVLAAVQPYRFCPAGAAVLKNVAPTEHVVGSTVPVFEGLVETADEKSTLLVCVRRSIMVWACSTGSPPSNASCSQTRIDFMIGIILLSWALLPDYMSGPWRKLSVG
jgi:hypothetical protein